MFPVPFFDSFWASSRAIKVLSSCYDRYVFASVPQASLRLPDKYKTSYCRKIAESGWKRNDIRNAHLLSMTSCRVFMVLHCFSLPQHVWERTTE